MAGSVYYDKHRNQLARVIENAVYFNHGNRFPQDVHVTLVTPDVFHSCQVRSRLHQYKYSEYHDGEPRSAKLLNDLTASCLPLRRPSQNLQERLNSLQLHWITYE